MSTPDTYLNGNPIDDQADPFPHIPQELKDIDRWLYWGVLASRDPDKPRKVPIEFGISIRNGPIPVSYASGNEWKTWEQFLKGWHRREGYIDGIRGYQVAGNPHIRGPGFSFSGQYRIKVIDHDDFLGWQGELKPHQEKLFECFPSWRELSFSGRGAHTFIIDPDERDLSGFINRDQGVDFFCDAGFIAMTGKPLELEGLAQYPLSPCTEWLDWFCGTYGKKGRRRGSRKPMPEGTVFEDIQLIRGTEA